MISKTMNKANRTAKIIRMINQGATWSELESKFGITRVHMQRCLRAHYKKDVSYNVMLVKARKNGAREKQPEEVIHIAEAGALINHPTLLYKKPIVFVPDFCKSEIKKISQGVENDFSKILESRKICWVHLEGERLNVLPEKRVKPRVMGVIALCCVMAKRNNKKIKLYTNSQSIVEVAKKQGLNIEIVKY